MSSSHHVNDHNLDEFDLETRPSQKQISQPVKILGKSKSGKTWKTNPKKQSKNVIDSNKGLKQSWERKMALKADLLKVTEKNKKVRADKKNKLRSEAQSQKDKAKRKELNTFKSSTYQIIKDSKKIKKWSKKARSELAKLPTEIFEKVIKKEYNY